MSVGIVFASMRVDISIDQMRVRWGQVHDEAHSIFNGGFFSFGVGSAISQREHLASGLGDGESAGQGSRWGSAARQAQMDQRNLRPQGNNTITPLLHFTIANIDNVGKLNIYGSILQSLKAFLSQFQKSEPF